MRKHEIESLTSIVNRHGVKKVLQEIQRITQKNAEELLGSPCAPRLAIRQNVYASFLHSFVNTIDEYDKQPLT